jgi:hypothetical protein
MLDLVGEGVIDLVRHLRHHPLPVLLVVQVEEVVIFWSAGFDSFLWSELCAIWSGHWDKTRIWRC